MKFDDYDHKYRKLFQRNFFEVFFTETDYEELRRHNASISNTHYNHLSIITNFVDCDCKHGWLARALRDFSNLVSMPNLRCNGEDGVGILEESADRMECDILTDATQSEHDCLLRKHWGETEIDAECKKGILPQSKNLRSLNVSGSDLTSFYSDLPETLQWIDYRHNRLSSADQAAVDAMFLSGRRVWLGGNQIICDCSNRILIDAIQEHSKQVEDYSNLTCAGSTQLLSSVSTAEICQISLKISIAVLGVLTILAVILALILRRYREEINMYLYSRGCCLSCLQKNESEKPYDAFISFAHGDDSYVREVLVPGLENSPEQFRVCVHYRDWDLGGWIPQQIMHSVTNSKRTILVLSNNFVQSTWSELEFRYALAHSSGVASSHLLILILDDVLERNLNSELQTYLDFNTYMRCDDPKFWQRLRYAMPHRNEKSKRTETKNTFIISDEKRNSPNMMDMTTLAPREQQSR